MKLVYIEWQDPTWHSDRNINSDWSLIKQKTAGMLVKEDKNFIRIALNIDEDDIGEFIDIPKSLILKKLEFDLLFYEYKTENIRKNTKKV